MTSISGRKENIINVGMFNSVFSKETNLSLNHTYNEASLYVHGVYKSVYVLEPAKVAEFHEFLNWLPHRMQFPANVLWFYGIAGKCSDGEAARKLIISLYDEYVHSGNEQVDNGDCVTEALRSGIFENKKVVADNVRDIVEDYILSIIISICDRPQDYSVDHMFCEAIAYLDGCVWGFGRICSEATQTWDEFKNWLNGQVEYKTMSHWALKIQQKYPVNKNAFKKLLILFEEYLNNKDPRNTRWRDRYIALRH